MGMFGSRGYITLADMDNMNADITALKETVKAIDTQVSGSSDLMYYAAGSQNTVPLSLTQTAIEAVRFPVNLYNRTFSYTFKAPFLEPPVVTVTPDTASNQYICSVNSVTKDSVSVKVTYYNGTTTGSTGEAINIIAIGKTAA
jgi:hypothetical protein